MAEVTCEYSMTMSVEKLPL